MASSGPEAVKKVIEQLRRSTAEKNLRAEQKAEAGKLAKKSDQDETKPPLSESMIRPPETSHVAESNARVDTVGQEQGRSLYSMAKSLASKPPVTQRHQPQPPRKDRFDRPPPRSIVISPPPRTNVFAGLGKKIRKPLAEKDQNMEGTPNPVTAKTNIEKVDDRDLAVNSLKRQHLEADRRGPLAPSLGKRRLEGDHNLGPIQKKSKVLSTSSVGSPEQRIRQTQRMLEQDRTGTSAPKKFETLLQRVERQAEPPRSQKKRRREEKDVLPPPKRRAGFQVIGLETIDDGYMKPPIQRRLRGLRPRGLYNHKGACFINAAAQALHSVREIAMMDDGKTLKDLFPSSLGQLAPEILQKARKGRSRDKAVKPLAEHFADKAAKQQLRIRPYWVNLSRQLSSFREHQSFNPILFQQVSGALFTGANGPMNGDEQEDVSEFMQRLLPEIGASDLFEAVLECRKNCRKCGEEKSVSVTRAELLLNIPDNLKRPENKVEFEHLLGNSLKDHSIFEFGKLKCDVCKEVGQWKDSKGWTGRQGNRLSVAPRYLFAHIPRSDYKVVETGGKNKDGENIVEAQVFKLRTQVVLPTGVIPIPCTDSGKADYELLAVIEHRGKGSQSGHFITTRNVDGKWFRCNDEEVTEIHRRGVENCSQAAVCLFGKVEV